MGMESVLTIMREALGTAMLIAAPMLLLGLITGVSISVFQAVTQINEMTLTFIPKIMAIAMGMLAFSPWMLQKMTSFATFFIANLSNIVKHGY